MEEMNQELMFKLQMFEQQIRQIQEQLQAVEQNIVELSSLSLSLGDLKGSQEKEIMAPVGRGIFVKSKIVSDELVVDIGGKNFVKKSVPQTQEVIGKQIDKLNEVKESLQKTMEQINDELTKTVMDAQKNSVKETKSA